FFFFNDTATTEIYTLSLHDALPISPNSLGVDGEALRVQDLHTAQVMRVGRDRKSTRLNSSHSSISYAVFCSEKGGCRGGGVLRVPRAAAHPRPSRWRPGGSAARFFLRLRPPPGAHLCPPRRPCH